MDFVGYMKLSLYSYLPVFAMYEQPHHTSTPTFDPGPVQAQDLWDDLVNVLATPLLADNTRANGGDFAVGSAFFLH